ncbi:exodeoxyribonuclease VII small subunit [Breznakibacter xylanolyticus]|uniref:Exodeoxyribonuclease VII small subunit n=1 Tax=Breznakibacter xylanolyticus TaxID=990 RepID=A0A2W7MYV1_9BACT|nr:exodeoxyribonuclease VII small subunit [Breznakibacter xylanolyticus]MBN2744948.1 exodeoxyribonuclease VII small subunit [Marinilabiliaceae bacterium]PZX12841.1 exodeoxyribonuclease VII small subunit [Breznakibacter xylanolyticus]
MSKKAITYSEAMAEIELILRKIEQEELDVDDLSEKVKRVATLIKMCKEKLHNTQEEVDLVLKEME